MTQRRAHETITKIATPFRGIFLHLTWDGDHIVGASLSHQQKDWDTQLTKLIEAVSAGLCAAIKAGPNG